MGFFADLKADLSQAVNELVPEETQNSVPFEDDLPDMPDPSTLADDYPEPRREKVIFHKIPAGMENVVNPIPPLRELDEDKPATRQEETMEKGATFIGGGTTITGEIVCTNKLRVGAGAVIIGNITAPDAVIAGAVKGDIDVKGPVALRSTAVVVGNIRSRSVQVDPGAVVEGMCSQCYAQKKPTSIFDAVAGAGKASDTQE